MNESTQFQETEIGLIPKDWSLRNLGSLLRDKPQYGANVSANKQYKETDIRYVRITDISESGKLINGIEVSISQADATEYILSDDDFLIARSGNTVGKSLRYNSDMGLCAYAGYLIRFRLDDCLLQPSYFEQILHSPYYYNWIKNNNRANAQPNINSQEYQSLKIPLPPLAEQIRIGECLSKMDERIRVVEEQIETVEKLKKGLMQQLLTRGIGHTEFVDHPEFGAIPKAWKVVKLGEVAEVERGKFSARPRNDPRYFGGKYPFVQTGDVTKAKTFISSYSQTLNEEGLAVSKVFPKGTILMTIAANIGEVAITQFEMACPDSLVGIIPNAQFLETHYLVYVLETIKEYLSRIAPQNAQKNINLQIIKPLTIPLPPLAEQKRIANTLVAIDLKIDTMNERRLSLLNLKSALMNDLLTGRKRLLEVKL